MINGLGVLGWGVGGIEAEAVMLGQPIYMLSPDVVGFRLTGSLNQGVTATDMTLRIVEMLRELGVVGKFVEFFGEGMAALSLPVVQLSLTWPLNMVQHVVSSQSMIILYLTCDSQAEPKRIFLERGLL